MAKCLKPGKPLPWKKCGTRLWIHKYRRVSISCRCRGGFNLWREQETPRTTYLRPCIERRNESRELKRAIMDLGLAAYARSIHPEFQIQSPSKHDSTIRVVKWVDGEGLLVSNWLGGQSLRARQGTWGIKCWSCRGKVVAKLERHCKHNVNWPR